MISIKLKNLKIATILPYKEDYSFIKASAVSLWVAEFFRYSKFKNNNTIYGSTKSNDFLTKNYINIELKSLNKKFVSTTNEYSKKLLINLEKKKSI